MRRKLRRWLMAATALATIVTVGGCAALERRDGPDPETVLRRGLSALESGHYEQAHKDLAWVYMNNPDRPAGRRALLALAALEMDPRNPRQRLAVGTQLLERLFNDTGLPRWESPLTETLYLLAVDLGAQDARADSLRASRRPTLPREPLATELRVVRAQRDTLRDHADKLEAKVNELQGKLDAANKELKRIQKTLHG